MLDEPADPQDPDQDQDQVSDPSPTHLHGAYPSAQYDVDDASTQPHNVQQDYYQHHYNHVPQQQPPTQQLAPSQQHPQYAPAHQQQPLMPASRPPTSSHNGMSAGGGSGPTGFAGGQMIDPNDPMLDADPFGLSASMHYPTAYSALDQPRLGQARPPPPPR